VLPFPYLLRYAQSVSQCAGRNHLPCGAALQVAASGLAGLAWLAPTPYLARGRRRQRSWALRDRAPQQPLISGSRIHTRSLVPGLSLPAAESPQQIAARNRNRGAGTGHHAPPWRHVDQRWGPATPAWPTDPQAKAAAAAWASHPGDRISPIFPRAQTIAEIAARRQRNPRGGVGGATIGRTGRKPLRRLRDQSARSFWRATGWGGAGGGCRLRPMTSWRRKPIAWPLSERSGPGVD